MSHIMAQTVSGNISKVHPAVLKEGIKILAQLLSLDGVNVTDYIFDWSGHIVRDFQNCKIIAGLNSVGAVSEGFFGGMGLAVDAQGKMQIVGDFYGYASELEAKQLKEKVDKLIGPACHVAARLLVAKAKGQNYKLQVNSETKQLQVEVEL